MTNDDFSIEVVPEGAASRFADFDCGNVSINHSFRDADSPVYRMIYKSGDTAGLATLSCSGIIANMEGSTWIIPAVKIEAFGIDNKFRKKRMNEGDEQEAEEDIYNVSDFFMNQMLDICRKISEEELRATHIVLYSVDYAEKFYKRNLFRPFEDYYEAEDYRYIKGCLPMYMEL